MYGVCVRLCSTHGLVHLVRARNINTVGELSSLSERQVQTLPIKSPKVVSLRNALHSFRQVRGGSWEGVDDLCCWCCRVR